MIANPPKLWRPDSWQARPATQQPEYPDAGALREALERLAHLPPLVTSFEVNALKAHLAEAQEGKRFVLQGGDCAESFDDCRPEIITNRLKVLLKISPGCARMRMIRPRSVSSAGTRFWFPAASRRRPPRFWRGRSVELAGGLQRSHCRINENRVI